MAKTKIEWATDVWNPVTGCSKVSAGCQHCYAERWAKRMWGERKFTDVRCHEDRLEIPLFATSTPQPVSGAPSTSDEPVSVTVTSSHSYIASDYYHIVGEVRNTYDRPVEFVEIIATLRDDAGKMTGSASTYTDLDVIPPGGSSPFYVLTGDFAGTTGYELQVGY